MAELQPPLAQSSLCPLRIATSQQLLPLAAVESITRTGSPPVAGIVAEIIHGITSTGAAVVEIDLAADVREPWNPGKTFAE